MSILRDLSQHETQRSGSIRQGELHPNLEEPHRKIRPALSWHKAEGDRDDIPYAALAHNCKISNYGLPDSVPRQYAGRIMVCSSGDIEADNNVIPA